MFYERLRWIDYDYTCLCYRKRVEHNPTSRIETFFRRFREVGIIATPHHWHAPIALAAIQSGKDIYVEKPMSHVFAEGRLIVEAAKKHNRVVQQGSQMRSSPVTAAAGKLLSDGITGEILHVDAGYNIMGSPGRILEKFK